MTGLIGHPAAGRRHPPLPPALDDRPTSRWGGRSALTVVPLKFSRDTRPKQVTTYARPGRTVESGPHSLRGPCCLPWVTPCIHGGRPDEVKWVPRCPERRGILTSGVGHVRLSSGRTAGS